MDGVDKKVEFRLPDWFFTFFPLFVYIFSYPILLIDKYLLDFFNSLIGK